jgi:hypothetical protein
MTTPRVIATLFFIVLFVSLIIESYPVAAAASAAGRPGAAVIGIRAFIGL